MRVRSGVMRFWHKKARTVAGKVCVTAVRVSGFEATAEAIGELVQQLAVHRLAGGEVSANRIEYRGFHFAVRRQFGDDFRRELRLAKEADDFVVGNHLVQFADAFRARFVFGIDAHGADGIEVVVFFKVLVGIVEDHERPFLHRLQLRGKVAFQRVQSGGGLGGVVFVFGGVGAIDCGQFFRDLIEQQLAARHAQPQVRVVSAVVVTVMVMAVFMIVIVMGIAVVVVMVFMIVVIIIVVAFFPHAAVAGRQRVEVGQPCPFNGVFFFAFFQKRRHEGFEFVADVHDDIRFCDAFRIRRFHLVAMRRALFDEQFGFADAIHHLRHQRMQRLDGGDDFRRGEGLAGNAHECGQQDFFPVRFSGFA